MIKKIFAKPGVTPGLFGGFAVPLALLVGANLPKPFQTQAFELGFSQCLVLFFTMPLLGAIAAHFYANRNLRGQFLTAVVAPVIILGTYLSYNNLIQKRLYKQKTEELVGVIDDQQQNRVAQIQATQPENPALLTGQDVQ